jgi:arylsulfatase A-like enzyme
MLGRLIDTLRAAGQLDRTAIVVTADHGESLGEHGETTHGLFAYESTLHVPMILSGPAIGPAVVEDRVGHVDLLPTLLDLVGVKPPEMLEGRSLIDPPAADRALYFEALDAYLTRGWAPLTGVVQAAGVHRPAGGGLAAWRTTRPKPSNLIGQGVGRTACSGRWPA